MTTYEERLDGTLGAVRELLLAKHHDYGTSNLKKHGLFGIIVRLSDKLARIENLTSKDNSIEVEESIMDTFIDIAGYGVQALIMMGEEYDEQIEKNLPRES
jgi:hypothetical protein